MYLFAGHPPINKMYRKRLAGFTELLTMITHLIIVMGMKSQHTREMGEKTKGINEGTAFFDTRSGEFRRHRESAEVEVIRRTPVRTHLNGEVVNKVLKRRRKYRLQKIDADKLGNAFDNSDEKKKLLKINESFKKLKPLKTKYKTSDSIRMHVRRPNHEHNISRATSSTQHENKGNLIETKINNLSINMTSLKKKTIEPFRNNFELKKKTKKYHFDKYLGAEYREHKTHKRLDENNWGILVSSGNHNSLSIQEPVTEDLYDPTVGEMRLSVFLGHFLMIVGDVRNTGGQLRDYPTSPSPYKQYPGLYFPPTSIEDRNPLKNYDFIIGA